MSGVTLSGGANPNAGVELSESGGRSLKLQTDTPHLVSLGGGRLSTAVTLHPIPQGRVTLGSSSSADILVQGTGVMPLHCHIENSGGVVTIYPLAEQLSIDGIRVTSATRLAQGVMLTIGRSNYMRFNHPAEAKLMKSVLPNPRISMAPISFEVDNTYQPSKYNKKPPVVPRRSPRESFSDEELPSNVMTKVSKFDYLAAQNFKKSVSPKVFPSNLVTVNAPAKDVLGKAPPDLNSFAKNLPQSSVNYNDAGNVIDKHKNKFPDRQVFGRKSPSHYVNVTLNDTAKNCNNRVVIHENGCIPKPQNSYQNITVDDMRVYPTEINNLNNRNFGSNQSLNKNGGANNLNRITTTPSPSFNRNPSPYLRSVTPSPVSSTGHNQSQNGSVGSYSSIDHISTNGQLMGVSGSIEDLAYRKNEAEFRRNQAYVERVKEQELERAEQARLDEILNMCAEYEKQVQWEKINKPTQNRIITNGSLPRDKRQCVSPNTPSDHQVFNYETDDSQAPQSIHRNNTAATAASYESVSLNHQHHHQQHIVVHYTPNSEHMSGNVQYENVEITTASDSGSPYENATIHTASIPHVPQSPRTRIKTFIPSPKDNAPKDFSEVIENKFATNHISSNASSSPSTDNSSKELSDTPKRKVTPSKFILPLDSVLPEASVDEEFATENSKARKVEEKARMDKLKVEKKDIMNQIALIKRKMADIEIQEEELTRELEMERALISGEHQSKLLELRESELRKAQLTEEAKDVEHKMEKCQESQGAYQEEIKQKLAYAEETVNRLESEMSRVKPNTPTYNDVYEEYSLAQEQLDNERKLFEDLEFHHLEAEADWLASREEIQREIHDLSQRNDLLNAQLQELDVQKHETYKANNQESKVLETELLVLVRKLEQHRTRLKVIEADIRTHSERDSEAEISTDSDSDKSKDRIIAKTKSCTGLNRVNASAAATQQQQLASTYLTLQPKHMTCAAGYNGESLKKDDIFNMTQSFNEKLLQNKSVLGGSALDAGGGVVVGHKCPSQDDIDRINKVTSNAPMNIDDGRGSLGRKTIESLKEIERNRQLHLVQQGSQVIEEERRRVLALKQRVQHEVRAQWAQQRRADCTSLTSTGSEDTQQSVSGSDEVDKQNNDSINNKEEKNQAELKLRSESEEAESSRPISVSSELSVEVGGTLSRRRQKPALDKLRPLTRYLPIRSSELNLRQHIESAGHQVDLCPHVMLDSSSCRGFLHKMGTKLHGWSRRWFVFDRNKRTLVYYPDKNEKKPRGGAYFQAIEDVYLDHLNSVKSPSPHLTFIIKTHERSYHLMAPSPEAMRIWVDVVFTGAEGYQEYEHGT